MTVTSPTGKGIRLDGRIFAVAPFVLWAAWCIRAGERRIWLAGWTGVPVYDFEALAPAQSIPGPAIVESAMTTVLLRPGDSAVVTANGWLDIAVPVAAAG